MHVSFLSRTQLCIKVVDSIYIHCILVDVLHFFRALSVSWCFNCAFGRAFNALSGYAFWVTQCMILPVCDMSCAHSHICVAMKWILWPDNDVIRDLMQVDQTPGNTSWGPTVRKSKSILGIILYPCEDKELALLGWEQTNVVLITKRPVILLEEK